MLNEAEEIIAVAKRENNQKRNYLVVNRLQGKYVPVHPKQALMLFGRLGELVKHAYPEERLLVVGFAETATAIGAALAVKLNTWYVQTTREQIEGAEYLEFLEAHSHAPEQRLVCNGLDTILPDIDRVIFAEDELTTGNTIINLVRQMKTAYPGTYRFTAASLLNGMDAAALERFTKEDIEPLFLLKINNRRFPEIAEKITANGTFWTAPPSENSSPSISWKQLSGWINARKCVRAKEYQDACEHLWQQIQELIRESVRNRDETKARKENSRDSKKSLRRRILVLGTEEFMYPALYAASRLEEEAENEVYFHATSRSPILPSCEEGYPLYSRYELVSLYEKTRKTFLYNLDAYDQVLVITDAQNVCSEGARTLAGALSSSKNQNIQWIRWCRI